MALSEKATRRLAQLGYAGDAALKFWQEFWQSQGEAAFWGILRREEKAAAQYRHWFPKLQQFAAECRRNAPIPTLVSLSKKDQEQGRILTEKMQAFVRSEGRRSILERKPNQAAIISTTRTGLAAAEQIFRDTGAILLQEENRERGLPKFAQSVTRRSGGTLSHGGPSAT